MSIVLSILQILGWSLLIVFLIIIIALFILLFCPLHYLVEGEWLEEKWARFKAHWLFHMIRAKVSYGDDLIYGQIHILWKKITFSFDLTEKKEEDEPEEFDEECKEADEKSIVDDSEDKTRKEEKVIGTETTAELRGEVDPWADSEDEELDDENSVDENSDDENSTEEDSKEDNLNKENALGEEQIESILSKIKGIINRIKEVYPKIKKILTDQQNQDAVKHLKDEVIYLIKILLPKKSKVNAVFSTGSPDTTGQLFGILACFPAMYQKDWKLMPDFQADEAYFKGTFWGKGWIAVYQLVGIILRIIFDKNCRRLYTIINKFIKWIKKDDKSQEEK